MIWAAAFLCASGATIWKCCGCTCFEPRDNWKIEEECRPGELGAGSIYKRGRGAAVWSKRFFVLTEQKLLYFTDIDRSILKGEIVLAGATAKLSTTRANANKTYYFTISHPECGMREFYVQSSNKRTQWVDKINEVSSMLVNFSVYGLLLKQGEHNKSSWRERWCLCSGRSFDYFESATDNQSKGSLDLVNAKVREFATKDQKYCFEIVATKKGGTSKKFVFAVEKEHMKARWIEMIKKASNPSAYSDAAASQGPPTSQSTSSPTSSSNPMVNNNEAAKKKAGGAADIGPAGAGAGGISSSINRKQSLASDISGFLYKRSPSGFKPWQNRYFILKTSSGEILYYDKEEDAKKNMQPKGGILMGDILKNGKGVTVVKDCEIHLKLKDRTYELKAHTAEEAKRWTDVIRAWIEDSNSSSTDDNESRV